MGSSVLTSNTEAIRYASSTISTTSPSTIEEIKQTILQMELDMAEALQLFHDERSSLLQKLNTMQASTKFLFPDVLSHIFLLVCDRESYQGQKMAHRLAGVCRYWQSVALSTPLLWSSLILFFGKRVVDVTRQCYARANLLRLHLDRVIDTPLSLTFLFDTSSPHLSRETFDLFASLLSQKDNTHKVQTLRLVRAPFEWVASFPALPQLGYLGIYDEETGYNNSANSTPLHQVRQLPGSTLPLLKSSRLYRFEVRGLHGFQPFPEQGHHLTWLTHVSVSCISINVSMSLLLHCPNLISFESSDPRVSKTDILHPNLQTTSMTNDRIILRQLQHFGWAHAEATERIRNFYRRLRFPDLRTFYWWSNHPVLDNDALSQLLPNLPSKSLYLIKIHSASQWDLNLVRSICNALPAIQILNLYGCDYTTMLHFLTILSPLEQGALGGLGESSSRRRSSGGRSIGGHEVYLPRLKRMSMDGIESYVAGEDQLVERIVETLRSRCHDVATAFSLELSKRDSHGASGPESQWSGHIQSAYQLMRDEGIDFKVWMDSKKTRLLGRTPSGR
ncbi:hypothetical protein AN958_06965 [Leucoagaricus sp. SymC.cos]|nr:hypothetical protein AN958_06965 [Leucoagaricus sp. SymC.cos]